MDEQALIGAVRRWLDTVVIDLNLCPFATQPLHDGRVRITASGASTEDELLAALQHELALLERDPAIETTLIIHAGVLNDFDDYNQFLDIADALLESLALTGVYQVASFHPEYRFAGTAPGDAGNYTNRSPLPLLQLLRESSIEQAILAFPDVAAIPERNIETMNRLGSRQLAKRLRRCGPGHE